MCQEQALPPLDSWEAAGLELIAFPADQPAAFRQHWWQELTGVSEFDSTRKKAERVDAGTYQGRHLRLTMDPLRCSWALMPAIEIDAEGVSLPVVGAYPEARQWFEELMVRWLTELCPPVTRIAFAARLVQRTESREHAYRLLGRYLPRVEVDPEAWEFQYRINRRRATTTGIPDLAINRLATWNAVRFNLQAAFGIKNAGLIKSVSRNFDACMLAVDINTDQEYRGNLPQEQLPAIWRELVSLGTEIATRGDVR